MNLRKFLKKAGNKARFLFRYMASSYRTLPNFMIIGVQKGGTTSLSYYLAQHHQIQMSFFKETHYFDSYYDKGLRWYKAFFPMRTKKNILVGEATPCYFFYDNVPARVKTAIPDCKFIVVLRNPVDRATSHYKMNVRKGNESINNFEDAIQNNNKPAIGRRQPDFYRYYNYLERGLYGKQLKNWLSYFPLEQFLFLKSEELLLNPISEMDKVFSFLNIEKHYPSTFDKKNTGAKSSLSLKPETIQYLKDYYRSDDEEVGRILGSKFRYS